MSPEKQALKGPEARTGWEQGISDLHFLLDRGTLLSPFDLSLDLQSRVSRCQDSMFLFLVFIMYSVFCLSDR